MYIIYKKFSFTLTQSTINFNISSQFLMFFNFLQVLCQASVILFIAFGGWAKVSYLFNFFFIRIVLVEFDDYNNRGLRYKSRGSISDIYIQSVPYNVCNFHIVGLS